MTGVRRQPRGRGNAAGARPVAVTAALLLLAGCAAPGNRLDALRRQEPDALARVAADYHVVAACLLDRELRRGYQPIPNLREHEGRATLTAYAAARPRSTTSGLLFEYSIEAIGPGRSRIAVKRTNLIH